MQNRPDILETFFLQSEFPEKLKMCRQNGARCKQVEMHIVNNLCKNKVQIGVNLPASMESWEWVVVKHFEMKGDCESDVHIFTTKIGKIIQISKMILNSCYVKISISFLKVTKFPNGSYAQ